MRRLTTKVRADLERRVRKTSDQKDAVGQTAYTLFLAFVPFAAVVSVLVALRDPSVLRLLEGLSRRLAQSEGDLADVRRIFGADGKTSWADVQEQMKWARTNKVRAELAVLRAIRSDQVAWWLEHGEVPFDAPDELEQVIALGRSNRCGSIYLWLARRTAGELGQAPQNLAPETKAEAFRTAAGLVTNREIALLSRFLAEVQLGPVLQHAMLARAGAEVVVPEVTLERIEHGVRLLVTNRFLDAPPIPPGDPELLSARNRLAASELNRLRGDAGRWVRELEGEVRALEIRDWRPEARLVVMRENFTNLYSRLAEADRGPLTEDRLREALANSYTERGRAYGQQLLAEVGQVQLPDAGLLARVQREVRTNRTEAERQIREALATALGGSKATNVTAFPEARQRLDERVNGLLTQVDQAEGQRIQQVLTAVPVEPLLTGATNLLAQVANGRALGEWVKSDEFARAFREAVGALGSDGPILTAEERTTLAQRLAQAVVGQAQIAKRQAVKDAEAFAANLPPANLRWSDLENSGAAVNRQMDAVSANPPAFLPFGEAQQKLRELMTQRVAGHVGQLKQQLDAYLVALATELPARVKPETMPVDPAERVAKVRELVRARFEADGTNRFAGVQGRYDDLPAALRDGVVQQTTQRFGQALVASQVAGLSERDLPDQPREVDATSLQAVAAKLHELVSGRLGNPQFLPEDQTNLWVKARGLQSQRYDRLLTEERAKLEGSRATYAVNPRSDEAQKAFEAEVDRFLTHAGVAQPLAATRQKAGELVKEEFDRKYGELMAKRERLEKAYQEFVRLYGGVPKPGDVEVPGVVVPGATMGAGRTLADLEQALAAFDKAINREERKALIREAVLRMGWTAEDFQGTTYSEFRAQGQLARLEQDLRSQAGVESLVAEEQSYARGELRARWETLSTRIRGEAGRLLAGPKAQEWLKGFRDSFWNNQRPLREWVDVVERGRKIEQLAGEWAARLVEGP